MKIDGNKTKEQLVTELKELRKRISKLEATETERKQAEEALRMSEERYLALFDRSLDCVYIHDFEGNFIDANNAALILLGYEKEDIPSINFASLLIEDEISKGLATLEELKETGTQKETTEFTLRCKNGKYVHVETKASVIFHDEKPYAIQGIARDITEDKQAEEKLRESEERYHSLYSTMREGVALHEVIYDESGKPVDYVITDVNPQYEYILGLSRDKVIGSKASDTYGAGEAPFLDIYAKVAQVGESAYFETFFPPMEKHFSISVFSPGKGKFATVFTDITERKKAEEAIRQSEGKYRTAA